MKIDDFKGYTLKDGKLVKKERKHNKYRNNKVEVDGIKFDSEKEAKKHGEYQILLKSGQLSKVERQVKMSIDINGKHIANYMLDFRLTYPDGRQEYIDVKAQISKNKFLRTDVFQLKKKLVEAIYGIEIKLV